MGMDKLGVYTDNDGKVVTSDDCRKKKDDSVRDQTVKTAEERLNKKGGDKATTNR